PASEGGLAELLDVLPPAVLREAILIVISTRPLNLLEEAERSSRLSGTAVRSLMGRVILLNPTQGDLIPLFTMGEAATQNILQHRLSSATQERLSSQGQRRRGGEDEEEGVDAPRVDSTGDGEIRR